MERFITNIENISLKIYSQLSGLLEQHFQTALGIEFRKNKINFMREAGLELFYEDYPLGLHELDFLITPCFDLKENIIIETKVESSISETHRQQLRNYLRSAKKNDNAIIKKISIGLILNFRKNETFVENPQKRKKMQNIQIEVWKFNKNKFVQLYSNEEKKL
jgi:GxxExxY protein